MKNSVSSICESLFSPITSFNAGIACQRLRSSYVDKMPFRVQVEASEQGKASATPGYHIFSFPDDGGLKPSTACGVRLFTLPRSSRISPPTSIRSACLMLPPWPSCRTLEPLLRCLSQRRVEDQVLIGCISALIAPVEKAYEIPSLRAAK
jgi:hypothetical protein